MILEQVFNEATLPDVTFVYPAEYPSFRSAVRAPGKHVTLSGPSGSGKTTLVKRLLQEEGILETSLLWINARKYSGVSGCFEMLGQELAEAPTFDAITPYLQAVRFVVVDDFHHLPGEARAQLASSLKLWHEYGVRFITIGIASSAAELLDVDPELGIRNEAYELSTQSASFTRRLIQQGCDALNVSFSEQLTEEIVAASRHIPSVIQLICRAGCVAGQVLQTIPGERRMIDLKLSDLREAVLRVFHGKYLNKVVGMAKGRRAARAVHNTYFDIVCAIKNTPRLEIPTEYLYAQVVRPLADVTLRKRKATSFYNCLKSLTEVIDERGLSDVLHFPRGGQFLTIEDPSFRFYMDLLDVAVVRSRIHLRADEYPYDVAVSFAGSCRTQVKELVDELKKRGLSVFYDFDQQAQLWGQDLRSRLADVYANEAQYMVIFVSKDYPERDWTDFELAIGKVAESKRTQEYLLPVLVDDTKVIGIHSSVGYIDLRLTTVARVAEVLEEKLSAVALLSGPPDAERPSTTRN